MIKIRKGTLIKAAAFALSLGLILAVPIPVSASDNEITSSGGSATIPVSLTTTNGGIDDSGGRITPTKLSVVVPTTLPLAMSDDGTIVTATDCKIINNSYGAVRVKKVTITAASGWNLTAFGTKSSMAHEKVNSNKLGFAISIGDGKLVKTTSEADTQVLISAPIAGCYMTGAGDRSGNTVYIDYSAIVTPVSRSLNNATVANVVFVVEWDTAN